jgi:hypothetical protein
MSKFDSPFLAVSVDDWICSNSLAFAIFDGFPVLAVIKEEGRV